MCVGVYHCSVRGHEENDIRLISIVEVVIVGVSVSL